MDLVKSFINSPEGDLLTRQWTDILNGPDAVKMVVLNMTMMSEKVSTVQKLNKNLSSEVKSKSEENKELLKQVEDLKEREGDAKDANCTLYKKSNLIRKRRKKLLQQLKN